MTLSNWIYDIVGLSKKADKFFSSKVFNIIDPYSIGEQIQQRIRPVVLTIDTIDNEKYDVSVSWKDTLKEIFSKTFDSSDKAKETYKIIRDDLSKLDDYIKNDDLDTAEKESKDFLDYLVNENKKSELGELISEGSIPNFKIDNFIAKTYNPSIITPILPRSFSDNRNLPNKTFHSNNNNIAVNGFYYDKFFVENKVINNLVLIEKSQGLDSNYFVIADKNEGMFNNIQLEIEKVIADDNPNIQVEEPKDNTIAFGSGRRGKPLTDEERLERHKTIFPNDDVESTEDLPPRGTGKGIAPSKDEPRKYYKFKTDNVKQDRTQKFGSQNPWNAKMEYDMDGTKPSEKAISFKTPLIISKEDNKYNIVFLNGKREKLDLDTLKSYLKLSHFDSEVIEKILKSVEKEKVILYGKNFDLVKEFNVKVKALLNKYNYKEAIDTLEKHSSIDEFNDLVMILKAAHDENAI